MKATRSWLSAVWLPSLYAAQDRCLAVIADILWRNKIHEPIARFGTLVTKGL